MANEAWIKRQTETPEARRRYEEERLILWTTEAIWKAMDEQGLTRAEMAERLGTSRANITQLLSGSRNMTLRSLASLAFACDLRAEIRLEELTASVFNSIDDQTIELSRSQPVRFWTEPQVAEEPPLFRPRCGTDEEEGDHPPTSAPPLRLVA